MVEVNYGENTYSLKSDVNELTIKDYEKINYYLAEEKDFFDKWFNILGYLGLPSDVIDEIDANELIDLVKSINLSDIDNVFIESIEMDGYTYTCEMKDGEPKITGKIFKLLESVCKKDYYIADIMAILFKRDDLSKNEHYEKAHIEYKSTLFRKEKASICIPYILLIAEKYIKNIQSLV